MAELSPSDAHELRAELLQAAEDYRQEQRDVAKARRRLRKRALKLVKQRGGYLVADHIGSYRDAPFQALISAILSWLDAQETRNA